MTRLPHAASAFGLVWRSDVPLDGFESVSPAMGGPEVAVRRVSQLDARVGGRAINRGSVHADGIRFVWGDEVAFDMTDGQRIGYCPGSDWRGRLPVSFYSTVAALTVAWRGMLPLHACTVELSGRAVLIAGRAGAGKSTLAAGLIAHGARFVADDLTVVAFGDGGEMRVPSGRPTMRLHADTAARLATRHAEPAADDPRGKWLVRPSHCFTGAPLPLGAILLLGDHPLGGGSSDLARLLPHVFRPRWLAALPAYARLVGQLTRLAEQTPLLAFPALAGGDETNRRDHAAQALACIAQVLAHRSTPS
ncbi:HPr kinase/phosphorylase [Sphingomonas sp. PAMC 26605]|uniref:HPr kinase/phosphorylase n=1 Tax=Sphingomonas sp. PAMC 26605 TaxID=1112214 RepID=UPI00026CDD3F|nr:hypothetical protein [Sphingomonas sp. PAMC 26605]